MNEQTVFSAPAGRWRNLLRGSEFADVFALPEQPLWRRAACSAAWVFALHLLEKILTLIRAVVLVRFLLPKDFGLFGICLIAVSALNLFNIHGLRGALIQKHDDSRRDLDTVWSILLTQNCLNAGLLLAFAPPIARFFQEPGAVGLIRAFSVALLLEALVNIGSIHFEKRLLFHKQFAFLLSGAAVEFIVAVGLAVAYRTVWALVAGAIAGKAARLLASYMLQDFRPALRFKWHNFRALFRIHPAMGVSTVLWFVLLEGDNIFVGRVLGIAALGFYSIAWSLASLTRSNIGVVLQRFAFSSFASIPSDPAELRNGYLKLWRGTAICVVPVSVGLAALAPEIVSVLLGPRWIIAIPILGILALLGALHVLLGNAEMLLRAMGNQRRAIIAEIIFVIVAAALVAPLTAKFQLVGVAAAMALGAAAGWIWAERQVLLGLKISSRELIYALESSLAAALLMIAAIYLLRGLFRQPTWLSLLSLVSGAGFMYLATMMAAGFNRRRILKAEAAVS